jgi:hypothetical protein
MHFWVLFDFTFLLTNSFIFPVICSNSLVLIYIYGLRFAVSFFFFEMLAGASIFSVFVILFISLSLFSCDFVIL